MELELIQCVRCGKQIFTNCSYKNLECENCKTKTYHRAILKTYLMRD